VRTTGGGQQTVGNVEVHAGRPSSGVGLNTAFVYNELTGVRALSEKPPFQLQSGDLLILQPAARFGESWNGLPAGVYLRVGHVGGTDIPTRPAADVDLTDPDRTIVETADSDRTLVGNLSADRTVVDARRGGAAPHTDPDQTIVGGRPGSGR
jgi:hypothetical protein